MITISTDLCYIILIVIGLYIGYRVGKDLILPKIIDDATTEIEKNPKWITQELNAKYYGFNDIDFILAESELGALPRFRIEKYTKRLEILIDNDTSTKDVEALGQMALAGKLQIKYGLFFPDKPLCILSVLCFILDGGEIEVKETEKRQETN